MAARHVTAQKEDGVQVMNMGSRVLVGVALLVSACGSGGPVGPEAHGEQDVRVSRLGSVQVPLADLRMSSQLGVVFAQWACPDARDCEDQGIVALDSDTLREVDRWRLPLRCHDVVADLSLDRHGVLVVVGCRKPEAWRIAGPDQRALRFDLPFPGRVIAGASGDVFVVGSVEIARVDAALGEVLARAPLPGDATKHGALVGETLVVASGEQIFELDAETLRQHGTSELGFVPACIDGTGQRVVLGGEQRLAFHDLGSGQTRSVGFAGRSSCEFGVEGNLMFVHRGGSSKEVLVLSGFDGEALGSVRLETAGATFFSVDSEHDRFCLVEVQQSILDCYAYTGLRA